LTAPLWVPLRLVLDLAGLCADGLYNLVARRGWFPDLRPPGPLMRRLLGLPALLIFPLWVTVELLGQGLARMAERATTIGLAVLIPGLLLLPVHGLAGFLSGIETGSVWVMVHAAVLADSVVILALAGWLRLMERALPTQRGSRPALRLVAVGVPSFVVGLLGIPLAPVWIPSLGMVWVSRRLLHTLVVRPMGDQLANRRAAAVAVLSLGLILGIALLGLGVLRSLHAIPGLASAPTPWLLVLFGGLILFPLLLTLIGTDPRSVTRFESFVAMRYLRGRRSGGFVSAITLISIVGVALGVCALNVVLGVMSGFETDLREKILGTTSHVLVFNYEGSFGDFEDAVETVNSVAGVTGSTPFIYTELMLKSSAAVTGAVLKGIHAPTVGSATDLPAMIERGPDGLLEGRAEGQALLDQLDTPVDFDPSKHLRPEDADLPGIVLGSELSDSLRVSVGDRVFVVSPNPNPGPLGTMTATMKPFRVAGIFYSGMYEYDAKSSYISLSAAQDFLKMEEQVGGIEVRVDDIYAAGDIARGVQKALGYPFWTRDWMDLNRSLFSALKLEKLAMGIILTFIVVVAALNIISALIMVVLEKGREIAILKAMGSTPLRIMKVFMIEGLVIGFIGTTLGTALGWLICWALERYRFIPLKTDVYYLDRLPVEISWATFAVVAAAAVGISFAATLFPSQKAADLDPVEGLRYE
jgi:lipoprotein-releasing system permease protein